MQAVLTADCNSPEKMWVELLRPSHIALSLQTLKLEVITPLTEGHWPLSVTVKLWHLIAEQLLFLVQRLQVEWQVGLLGSSLK